MATPPTKAPLLLRKTGSDRPSAIVLVPVLPTRRTGTDVSVRTDTSQNSVHSPEERATEARGLAEAIDLDVRKTLIVPVATPRPATLFGSGKVEELRELIAESEITLAVIDHAISPVQQRNLERAWNIKVLDRTGLILEIFGARARTREGRLQVELAHLSYQKGRLVRAWTHLERQRGGGGGGASFLGGPGEAQIELDRRMLQTRIDAIRRELNQVVKTRALHRKGRRKVPYPIVAIVGYTNAGKSTLFNRITGASVLAKDQVFATLDPTMREVRLASGRQIILSDTVGFISDLPTSLVAAFRATLEEVIEADLILHVRDISHAESELQRQDVERVLADLDIDLTPTDRPILEVWNKIDLLPSDVRGVTEATAQRQENRPALVSAQTGEGIEDLLAAIDTRLGADDTYLTLVVPAREGKLLSWLHDNSEILERTVDDNGETTLRLRIAAEKRGRLLAQLQHLRLRVQ
ncbi:GTPase HflX [Filomicrobium sp.]|uniref:GTPase HflX n=1 Tax=Filomicrobium sp. TaxID=2024831 RepID=UPI0025885A90|nr:GTPase HflX [Filomicrobium sp.]MCV0371546.1 GTPase HflX [Filomicrobium sp.]